MWVSMDMMEWGTFYGSFLLVIVKLFGWVVVRVLIFGRIKRTFFIILLYVFIVLWVY